MRNKLVYIIILAFSIFFVGCTTYKYTPELKKQLNNEESEEKTAGEVEKESNERPTDELKEDPEISHKENQKESDKKGIRSEIVKEAEENKVVTGNKKKIIYLTFDDGPSNKVTNDILNILKENNVKGTFFLIGNQIKGREVIIKRIYNEGHSIGLHSYTHNYKKIYNNENNFIKEMLDCRNEINKVVGISPNIIRFPGGSCKRLNKDLLKKLHDKNLKVYDWNMENSDGLKPKTPSDELYEKAIRGSEKKENIMLLLHCTDNNENTSKALPGIIKYYKSKGYEFRVITEQTKELYAPIKD